MTKTSKKILLAILLFIATILLSNAKVFAATSAQEAFEIFKNEKFDSRKYMYVGESEYIFSADEKGSLKPEITISDNKRVRIEKDNYNSYSIKAIKEGCTDVTITVKYNKQTVTKKFWLGVVKDLETKIIKLFAYEKYPAEYTIAIGETINLNNYWAMLLKNTKVTVSNSNLEIIREEDTADTSFIRMGDTNLLQGKKVGTTTATITACYGGETVQKKFKVYVKKLNNPSLQSSTDDIKTITQISKNKIQVLLANGELWNMDPKTYKLTSKEMGNVSNYICNDYQELGQDKIILKNDKTLIVSSTRIGTYTAKNIMQISREGCIDTNKNYYLFRDKKLEKYDTNVDKLYGNGLYRKNGVLYNSSSIFKGKVSNDKIIDAAGSTDGYGIYLNDKNTLYKYEYNYDNNNYKVQKIEENVKYIISANAYRDKSGNVKYTNNKYISALYEQCGVVRITDETQESINIRFLELTPNKNLYLNAEKILTNVDKCYRISKDIYLIVKTDGSIWRLQLGGNYRFDRVRTGLDSAKKITKTGGLIAKKISDTQAKITWRKVEGAKQYTIYRSSTKDGKYAKIGTSGTTSYIDKSVKKGQAYYYKVVVNAVNAKYDSVMSLPTVLRK